MKKLLIILIVTGIFATPIAIFASDIITIKYEAEVITDDLLDRMLEYAIDLAPDLDEEIIVIEGYFMEEGIISLQAKKADLIAYENQEIDETELISNIQLKDLRSMEKMIEYDLSVFDVLIQDIIIDKEKVLVEMEFMGSNEEDFWKDYSAMALIAVENLPWVKRVEFSYLDSGYNNALYIVATKENILQLAEGKLSPEDFVDSLVTTEVNFEGESQEEQTTQRDENNGDSSLITILLIVVAAGIIALIGKKLLKR